MFVVVGEGEWAGRGGERLGVFFVPSFVRFFILQAHYFSLHADVPTNARYNNPITYQRTCITTASQGSGKEGGSGEHMISQVSTDEGMPATSPLKKPTIEFIGATGVAALRGASSQNKIRVENVTKGGNDTLYPFLLFFFFSFLPGLQLRVRTDEAHTYNTNVKHTYAHVKRTGKTWTEPTRLEDESVTVDSAYGTLAITEYGRLYAMYNMNLDKIDHLPDGTPCSRTDVRKS